MAIGRMIRPRLIAAGYVAVVRERFKKGTTERYGWDITIQQDDGAQLVVQVFDRDGVTTPPVGTFWAASVEVQESAQYGASLVYAEDASSALDVIHSALSVGAGK